MAAIDGSIKNKTPESGCLSGPHDDVIHCLAARHKLVNPRYQAAIDRFARVMNRAC